jgi:hypothetical protein|tara:strand:- start:479 stop:643 length:165 start_codon:yes stop_codon:yes gene_type:complete
MPFSDFGRPRVLAAFGGGKIISDSGGLLLRETASQLNLWSRLGGMSTATGILPG